MITLQLPCKKSDPGSVLLAALIILAVTFAAVSATLFEAAGRYKISHQSSRWAQAGQAAEGGCEIGLVTAQNSSWVVDGWSGAPGAVGSAAVTKTVVLDTGMVATGAINASIAADQVNVNGVPWLRIRSTGTADLAAGKQSGIDTADNLLRKVALLRNRYTNTTLTTPQATRTFEMMAEPKSPFGMAILLSKSIDMTGGSLVDSFDSSDPTKSTGSQYDSSKRQSNGNIGLNKSDGSNLQGSYVYGKLDYTGTPVQNTYNVQGAISTPFKKPIPTVSAPTWSSYNPTPTIISSSKTLTGGPQGSPAYYKVTSLSLSGGNILDLAPHSAGQQSYIEIWVTGDVTTTGSAFIQIENGVHATFHVGGDMKITGSAIVNANNISTNAIVNVITPAPGVAQAVTINGGASMIAAINAPGADFTLTGGAVIYGALIGQSLKTTGTAMIHYDEALAKLHGTGYGYKFSGFAEAVR